MITVSNLSKSHGDRTLFADVSLNLDAGHRHGVVGANGSGKSTFLRLLAGSESPSSGSIAIPRRCQVGLLEQDRTLSDELPILDVAMMGRREVYEALVEKEAMLAAPPEAFDGDRFATLEDVVAQGDGYALEAQAGEILEGLGIPTAVHRQPLSTLSGGFKLRVLLARLLAARPDVLLLDEPTNHLDIVSVRWLEKFLAVHPGCVLIVSHDHRFLDNACTRILDVDYERITAYTGNYSAFVAAKTGHRDRMEAEIDKRQRQIADHQAFIDRFKAKATKARQAQSRKKLLDRMVLDELPRSSRRHPAFRFRQARHSGREVLVAEGLRKAYRDNLVLDGVGMRVHRGDRLAVIGPNGIGKSTLLKILVGDLAPDAGTVTWGHEARVGYFAQDLDAVRGGGNATVESWLWESCPGEPIGFVRGHLGALLFSGDDVQKRVANLSGGEAARLAFCRLVIEQPNILVLDEPSNHLDLEAVESLVEGLAAYDGTVVMVSHDRWLVSRVASRILEITPAGINDFRGGYDEYLEACGDDHLDVQAASLKARPGSRAAGGGNGGATTEAPSRGGAGKSAAPPTRGAAGKSSEPPARGGRPAVGERDRRRLRDRRDELTAAIEVAEARVGEVDAKTCAPDFYRTADPEQVKRLAAERQALAARLDELMAEWERLEEKLA